VKHIVRKPTERNVELLMVLHEMEMEGLRSGARSRWIRETSGASASTRRTFRSADLLTDLRVTGRSVDDTQQEFVDVAEHFRTSPESCRLIELAQSHRSKDDFTETTITQFTAAESVAEYLAMPHGVFADPRHPALSFN
jgi:hypothetical protein